MVKQISVFIENKHGSIKEVLNILAENNINIDALSVADTTEFGVARMIVNSPELAQKVLSEAGIIVRVCKITAVAVEDEPGALMKTFSSLEDNNIAIEYMYAFGEKINGNSVLAIRTDNLELACECLKNGGVKVLEESDINA